MKVVKNIQSIAKNALINEGEAILTLSERIDDSFEACVHALHSSTGRIVITGVGKSAIVASKLTATFNSTGSPALFMHAADAIHGDLGMVQKEDVVICLSKSGNTPEIKVLIPLLKRIGTELVAIVSNPDSYLAKQSDHFIDASIREEACPNNLAPTTSTTVHMAVGDALAICLMELKGFSPRDFALNHPGGALGKKLYLRVNDIITHNEVPVVGERTILKDVILEISSKRLGATAVVDEEGSLLGIITDGDLRRAFEKGASMETLAFEIMGKTPKTVELDEYAVKALNMMQKHSISQVVVKDGKKPAGFVHLHDLLREGII